MTQANRKDQAIVTGGDLPVVAELSYGKGEDHAEGNSVISPSGAPTQLLVV